MYIRSYYVSPTLLAACGRGRSAESIHNVPDRYLVYIMLRACNLVLV